MNAFRDPAFPSNPATPTTLARSYKKDAELDSNGPMFPGGWQTMPVDWKVVKETGFSTSISDEQDATSIPIHEIDCHIEVARDMPLR